MTIRRALKKELCRMTADAIAEYERELLPRALKRMVNGAISREMTAGQQLRQQCLAWAFQTREFCDGPGEQVLGTAKGYYNFIMIGPDCQEPPAERTTSSHS